MYLSSNPCSDTLLTFHFTGAVQHKFFLKFHSTVHAHYPPTSPKLPHITFPPLRPCHLTVLLPSPTCHLTPPIHLSYLPSSLISHFFQLTSLEKTNRILQNGNVLSLGRQDKHVWLRVRSGVWDAVWDAPLTLRDLAEAISKPKFSRFHYNSLPYY